MLIPRYTIRWLLGLTTFAACVSLVLAHAIRGQAWAIGMASGLWTLVVVAVLFVAAFLCAWLMNQISAVRRAGYGMGVSPFRDPLPNGATIVAPPPQQTTDTPPAMTG